MSLDQLGRAAADDLITTTTTGLDGAAMFANLQHTRRRRSHTRAAVAGLAAIAVVLGGWAAFDASQDGAAPVIPAGPSPTTPLTGNGPIVVRGSFGLQSIHPVTGPDAFGVFTHTPADPPGPETEGGPQWSPDGQTLYYASDTAIRAFDVASGGDVAIGPCTQCSFSASPDGLSLAVAERDELRILNLAGGQRTIVREPDGSIFVPSWSRSGDRIAYVRGSNLGPNFRTTVETVAPDGSERTSVFTNGETRTSYWDLAWSGDDATIAVLQVPRIGRAGDVRVLTGPSSGGPLEELLAIEKCPCRIARGLTWSPDGSQLAIASGRGLFVVDARPGARPQRIGGLAVGHPAWRPVP